jgi:hypothetical protein
LGELLRGVFLKEEDLYADIRDWLYRYLKGKYGRNRWEVYISEDSHKYFIEDSLQELGVERGLFMRLKIKVDVVALLRKERSEKLVLVEVKQPPITLKDLGQLWGYTQLLNPIESFLLSPNGTGSLSDLYHVLHRDDLFAYGDKRERKMIAARWDAIRKTIDLNTLVPDR